MKYKITIFIILIFVILIIIGIYSFQGEGKTFEYNNWYSAALSNIEKSEYYIKYNENKNMYSCPNRQNNLRFYFYDNGFRIESRTGDEWYIEMNLLNIQRGKEVFAFQKQEIVNDTNHLLIMGKRIIREYINMKKGLKDNYIILFPIEGNGDLELNIEINTNTDYQISSGGVGFTYNNNHILDYKGLKVKDAFGNTIPSRFEKTDNGYKIIINDKNAHYPLTI